MPSPTLTELSTVLQQQVVGNELQLTPATFAQSLTPSAALTCPEQACNPRAQPKN